VHGCIHIHVLTCVYTHIIMYSYNMHACIHAYTPTRKQTYVDANTQIHTSCKYTHTQTHIQGMLKNTVFHIHKMAHSRLLRPRRHPGSPSSSTHSCCSSMSNYYTTTGYRFVSHYQVKVCVCVPPGYRYHTSLNTHVTQR